MTVSEHSHILFGARRIDYGIRRSPRRKTVAVTIDPAAGVVLSAPAWISVRRLDQIVRRKAPWIVRQQKQAREHALAHPPREFASGESYLYLGRRFRLQLVPGEREEAKLAAGRLRVGVPLALEVTERRELVRQALEAWYRRHAGDKVRERVEEWRRRIGVSPPTVLIRGQRRRWGSCDSKGTLRINWRIIQAPLRLVDYLVVHELAHLLHRGHGPGYWAAVGRVMPDYGRRRRELRELGPTMAW